MPQLNTDLTDLSDVTDEAIEAALRVNNAPFRTPATVRVDAAYGNLWATAIILLARCIQAHYPEMIVDPVTLKARGVVESLGYTSGGFALEIAKAAILAGMAMERGK